MAESLRFDLVSPERLLISEEVESVVVPGSEGSFTVLARHAPFMSTLRPGVIEVRDRATDERTEVPVAEAASRVLAAVRG